MGFSDGAYTPASIAATLDAAPPSRHGLAIGIQQMMLPARGLGLAPLAVNAMLHVMDWRLTLRVLRPSWLHPGGAGLAQAAAHNGQHEPREPILTEWRLVLAYRNVRLSIRP